MCGQAVTLPFVPKGLFCNNRTKARPCICNRQAHTLFIQGTSQAFNFCTHMGWHKGAEASGAPCGCSWARHTRVCVWWWWGVCVCARARAGACIHVRVSTHAASIVCAGARTHAWRTLAGIRAAMNSQGSVDHTSSVCCALMWCSWPPLSTCAQTGPCTHTRSHRSCLPESLKWSYRAGGAAGAAAPLRKAG